MTIKAKLNIVQSIKDGSFSSSWSWPDFKDENWAEILQEIKNEGIKFSLTMERK